MNYKSLLLAFLICLTGIAPPPSINVSNASVLLMIVTLPILCLGILKTGRLKRPTFSMLLVVFLAMYSLWAIHLGNFGYPFYFLVCVFYIGYFYLFLSSISDGDLLKGLVYFSRIAFLLYLIQVVGAVSGSDDVLRLTFLNAVKSNIEFFGPLPRASGSQTEPAHLSYALLPLITFLILFKETKAITLPDKIITVVTYVCTFSIIAYAQVLMVLMFKVLMSREQSRIYMLSLMLCVSAYVFVGSDIFADRINGVMEALDTGATLNTSVYALISNFRVMSDSLGQHFFLGSGLTGHRVIYDSVILVYFPQLRGSDYIGINQNDAASGFMLFLSEFGAVGLLVFICVVLYAWSRGSKNGAGFSIVFLLCLFLVLLRFGILPSVYIMLPLMYLLTRAGALGGRVKRI